MVSIVSGMERLVSVVRVVRMVSSSERDLGPWHAARGNQAQHGRLRRQGKACSCLQFFVHMTMVALDYTARTSTRMACVAHGYTANTSTRMAIVAHGYTEIGSLAHEYTARTSIAVLGKGGDKYRLQLEWGAVAA